MACACRRLQVVQPFELRVGELDAVGCGVLLDAGDAAGTGALNLLGSWAATIDNAEPERSTEQS